MRKIAWVIVVAAAVGAGGCSQVGDRPVQVKPNREQATMFSAVSMRIHPIFTQIKDWTGDGKPDGIEAEIEFQDRFQDPTKAEGKVLFELFAYDQTTPDPRGGRLVNPWIGSIATVEEQQARWNRTSRTYSFQLAYPAVRRGRTYVLSAIFEPKNGPRLFDRIILKPEPQESKSATKPSSGPSFP